MQIKFVRIKFDSMLWYGFNTESLWWFRLNLSIDFRSKKKRKPKLDSFYTYGGYIWFFENLTTDQKNSPQLSVWYILLCKIQFFVSFCFFSNWSLLRESIRRSCLQELQNFWAGNCSIFHRWKKLKIMLKKSHSQGKQKATYVVCTRVV